MDEAMVYLRDHNEVEAIRRSAQLVAKTLQMLRAAAKPGVTTGALDRMAERFIRDHGGRPAFKGYRGFPASFCPAINDEVVHGIPGDRILKDGDILGLDVGVVMDGYFEPEDVPVFQDPIPGN